MKYIIGVDGGGTKTEAISYDFQGNIVSKGISGAGNPLINEKLAIANLNSAINQCTAYLRKEDFAYLYIGLAGYGGLSNKEDFEKKLSDIYNVPCTVDNDAVIAHAALLSGKDGVLTISGTGSVSLAKYKETTAMAGGWGHLLGDEGSGMWIALEAFKKMTVEDDRQLATSRLTKNILSYLKCKEVSEMKKHIYTSSKGEIASIVPIIVEQANAGEREAYSILQEAGSQLAKTTLNAYYKLPFTQPVKIAVKGSILTKIPIVQSVFIDKIKEKLPETKFITDDVSSTLGGYYLALKKLKEY